MVATSVADIFVQIGVNGLASVTSALGSVKNFLGSLGSAASSMINSLAGSGGVIGGLAKTFQGIIQLGSGLTQLFVGVGKLMFALAPSAMAVGNAIYNSLNVAFMGLPEKLKQLGMMAASGLFQAFAAAGQKIGQALQFLAPLFVPLAPLINAIGAKMQQAAAVMKQGFAAALAAIGTKFAQLKANFGNGWQTIKASAVSAAGIIAGAFVSQFQKLDNLLGGKLSAAAMHAKIAANVIKTSFQQAVAIVAAQMPQIAAAFAPVKAALNQSIQGIKTAFSGVKQAIVSSLGPPALAVFGALTAAASSAMGAISGIKTVANATGAAIQAMFMNFIPIFGGFFNIIRSGFSSLVGMARSLASAMLTPLRMLGNFIFSIRGAIAALGISLSAAAIGKYIVEVSSDAEQAAVSFEVMLRSAGQAKAMLAQIQELADKTVLQLPEVRQGARTLLAMNVAASQVVPTLRMLGDVSQGVQIPLNDLVQIYGKINQKNRIMGDDLRQFGRRGIPIVRELAKQFNVSTDAIYEMASQGKLHFADLERAFKSLTGEGGEFHDLMERMSQTVSGRFSTMQDSIRAVAVQIGEALAPALKQAIVYITEFANWAKRAIGPYKDQIAELSQYIASRIPPTLEAIKSAIPVLIEGAKAAFAVMKAVNEMSGMLFKAIAEMVGGTDKIADSFIRIAKYIQYFATQWPLLFELAKQMFDHMGTNAGNIFSQLFAGIGANLSHIGGMLKEIVSALMDYMEMRMRAMGAALSASLRGDPLGQLKALEEDANKAAASALKTLGMATKRMFTGLPGFNMPKMLGLDDPGIKNILDILARGSKLFVETNAPEVGRAQEENEKVKAAQHGMPEGEMKERGKIGVEGLAEYYRSIQQSVTPQERKMEKLAEKQLEANKRTAVAVEKLANRPVSQAAFA